jgi:hypothetical protein
MVMTVAAIASGLWVRSRFLAEKAAYHRKQVPTASPMRLLSLRAIQKAQAGSRFKLSSAQQREFDEGNAMTKFHEEAATAYERGSRMPWLPVLLPAAPKP